ncbi:hypothetical protein [Enterovibrio norvegicus]|uniref:hypothetical protein n=1 Tax=Enterovibrio norvegicus TaxID=188144 RepID=UPI000C846D7E|nr:hypothetical protein [Enterovibrio norvegicus]PMI30207.1 hypothetical protein BCU47_18665 [Enterovibrio norvegicus]
MNYDFFEPEKLMEVQAYIHNHWKENHTLSKSKDVFDWLYHNDTEQHYNMMYADDSVGISSVLGYIPASKWDANNDANWLALWSTKAGSNNGLALLLKYMSTHRGQFIGILGLSDAARNIYRSLGFCTGEMIQHLLVNDSLTDYELLQGATRQRENAEKLGCNSDNETTLTITTSVDLNCMPTSSVFPARSNEYLVRKYESPKLKDYIFISLRGESVLPLNLVALAVEVSSKKCLRIVDYAGDIESLGRYTSRLKELAVSDEYEYVEFMSNQPCNLQANGWIQASDDFYAPIYFAPFVTDRKVIEYAYRPKENCTSPVYLVKGDGDQERP